jgi:hypothetical protein
MLEAILSATERTQAMVASARLKESVEEMVAQAHTLGTLALYGASEVGFFIAGAMVHRSQRLHLWHPGEQGAVLLIDGVLAGLAGLQVAADHIRSAGAEHVDALVLGLLADTGRAPGYEPPTHISLSDAGRAAA